MKLGDTFKIEDIVTYVYSDKVGTSYGRYEIEYHQESNKFMYYTKLFPFFFEDGVQNKAVWNDFHSCINFERGEGSKISDESLAEMIFNSFYNNHNVIISKTGVRSREIFIDESFEDCRLRCCWEVLDFIGQDKYGKGNWLSQSKNLKYYRPKPKSENNQYGLDLD